jgi:hypothetical protein
MLLTGGTSVLVGVTNMLPHLKLNSLMGDVVGRFQLWRLATNHFFFTSPGEVLFGLILFYYFRLFERQMGSAKFGVHARHTTHNRAYENTTRARHHDTRVSAHALAHAQAFAFLSFTLSTLLEVGYLALFQPNSEFVSGPCVSSTPSPTTSPSSKK